MTLIRAFHQSPSANNRKALEPHGPQLINVDAISYNALTIPAHVTKPLMNRNYEHAPIREAVCEFHFTPDSPWDIAIPGLFYAALKDEFPKRVYTQEAIPTTLTVGPQIALRGVQAIQTANELRFWHESDDGVIKLRPHSLSISHFKPYRSWDQFHSVIMQVFNVYLEIANPTGLQRIGLRYINEFEFDINNPNDPDENTTIDTDEFFDLGPKLGDRLIQPLSTFLVGIHYHFDDQRDSLRIQMQPTPSENPDKFNITLDLDYYLNQPERIAFGDVNEWMDNAHKRIGESFEGCIKEPLRARLQEGGA